MIPTDVVAAFLAAASVALALEGASPLQLARSVLSRRFEAEKRHSSAESDPRTSRLH